MNRYQQDLYDNLIKLTETNEAFYYQDFDLDQLTYRIFNYRLASYTDFLALGAMECRGIMFEVAKNSPVRLCSHPMRKFFNADENPMTMNLDFSAPKSIEVKADGSLISTYIHNDTLRLKSKGSLSSDQALAAMKWLARDHERHPDTTTSLEAKLLKHASDGWTVNLEWCAGVDLPEQRIVIGYQESHLRVLNARHNHDGSYMPYEELLDTFGPRFTIARTQPDNPAAFIAQIPTMEAIEGFVITLESGLQVKIKTDWYLSLHRAKDSINSDRRLFEAVLDEAVDDLLALFVGDEIVRQRVEAMQIRTNKLYNHTVAVVEQFYADNKDLCRKDYAIKGQHTLDKIYFGLAMMKYIGKETNYKEFLKSHFKDFGIKDQTNSDPDEIETMANTRARKPSKKDIRKFLLEK